MASPDEKPTVKASHVDPADMNSPQAEAVSDDDTDKVASAVKPDEVEPTRKFMPEYFPRDKFNPAFVPPDWLVEPDKLRAALPPESVCTWEERFAAACTHPGMDDSFAEVKKQASAKGWFGKHDLNDWGLLRFTIARQWNVKKTMEMLEKHVKWCEEFKPSNLRCLGCDKDPSTHMMHFVGWSKVHRPVIYCGWQHARDRQDPALAIKHNIECLESVIQTMPTGVEKWDLCTDFVGYSHWQDSRSSVGKAVIDTLQNHYPERLGTYYLIDPPTSFWIFWKMLCVFIDAKTQQKVSFVYTEKEPKLKDAFDAAFPEQLAKYLAATYNDNKRLYKEAKK